MIALVLTSNAIMPVYAMGMKADSPEVNPALFNLAQERMRAIQKRSWHLPLYSRMVQERTG